MIVLVDDFEAERGGRDCATVWAREADKNP